MTPAASSSAASHFWFPNDNSLRAAIIPFKLYRRVKHHLMQASSKKGVIRKILTEFGPFLT